MRTSWLVCEECGVKGRVMVETMDQLSGLRESVRCLECEEVCA